MKSFLTIIALAVIAIFVHRNYEQKGLSYSLITGNALPQKTNPVKADVATTPKDSRGNDLLTFSAVKTLLIGNGKGEMTRVLGDPAKHYKGISQEIFVYFFAAIDDITKSVGHLKVVQHYRNQDGDNGPYMIRNVDFYQPGDLIEIGYNESLRSPPARIGVASDNAKFAGSINAVPINKVLIPNTIQYSGNLINSVGWSDVSGRNIVIATETGVTSPRVVAGTEYRDAALFAYCYVLQNGNWNLNWKINDFNNNCDADVQAQFIKNAFAVTDLDKDGKAEIWLMYKISCRSDYSPSDMKIIMYEDKKKYAIRGSERIENSSGTSEGGEFSIDGAFEAAPAAFKQYAIDLWQKNVKTH